MPNLRYVRWWVVGLFVIVVAMATPLYAVSASESSNKMKALSASAPSSDSSTSSIFAHTFGLPMVASDDFALGERGIPDATNENASACANTLSEPEWPTLPLAESNAIHEVLSAENIDLSGAAIFGVSGWALVIAAEDEAYLFREAQPKEWKRVEEQNIPSALEMAGQAGLPETMIDYMRLALSVTSSQASSGVYYLPYEAGTRWKVTRAGSDHGNAVDFGMPVGRTILAAADGVLGPIIEHNTRCSCDPSYAQYNNQVKIVHDNGEISYYLHLATDSVPDDLYEGKRVTRGTVIGKSDQIGYTCSWNGTRCGPHLHFAVHNQSGRVAPYFADIGGYASTGGTYTSGNVPISSIEGVVEVANTSWLSGVVSISGWAKTGNYQVARAEVWIGGVPKGNASYGLPRPDVGGDFGYNWSWETNSNPSDVVLDGQHEIQVKAVLANGDSKWLLPNPVVVNTDNHAPGMPDPTSVNPGCMAKNNVWQNTCNDPYFTWGTANDGAGSGTKDYTVYWGPDPNGVPTQTVNSPAYDPGPIANGDRYYLRIQARDNIGNVSIPWTIFVLAYNITPPEATLLINNGADTVNQVDVRLTFTGTTALGGIRKVRLSNNGQIWQKEIVSDNDVPLDDTTLDWSLPALDHRTITVFAEIQDQAGNATIINDTIYLDLTPPLPSSANFRLCARAVTAGGGPNTSSTYSLFGVLGQALDNTLASASYGIRGGALAEPTRCWSDLMPTETYSMTHSVIDSGGRLRGSVTYRLGDSLGEPTGAGVTFASVSYQLQSGFWAGITGTIPTTSTQVIAPQPTPSPTPLPGPTATPQPLGFGLSLNDGAEFTNSSSVTVSVSAPNVNAMRLSNEAPEVLGLAALDASDGWQSYQVTSTWTLSTSSGIGAAALGEVYAWFRDANGEIYGPYFGQVVYDVTPPEGNVYLLGSDEDTTPTVTALWVEAFDAGSGIDQMRLGYSAVLADAAWQPFQEFVDLPLQDGSLYFQFKDKAGNVSPIRQVDEGAAPYMRNLHLPLILR